MKYVALLKGINVGGKNIIRMSELKQSLSEIELYDIRTYIQSGNVIFESNKEEKKLQIEIEKKIDEKFGFSISVILRTDLELEQIILQNPFSESEIEIAETRSQQEIFYILLSDRPFSKEYAEQLINLRSGSELFYVKDREIYLLLDGSIRNSKLVAGIQKKYDHSTVRNWKTMNKIVSLINNNNS